MHATAACCSITCNVNSCGYFDQFTHLADYNIHVTDFNAQLGKYSSMHPGYHTLVALLAWFVTRNSYTMPTRAVWDLLPEPEGEGNKFHTARGSMV